MYGYLLLLVLAIVSVNIIYNYFELCTVALHHHMLVLIILVSSSTLKAYLVLLKLVLALASQLYLSVIRSVRLSPVAEISWKKNSLRKVCTIPYYTIIYLSVLVAAISPNINHGHYNNSTFS